MIQRIQSIYLLLTALVAGIAPFFFYLFIENGKKIMVINELWYMLAFMFIAFEAFAAIFLFKNRKLQTVINRVNILVNFILLGVFVYRVLMMSGETAVSEKGIGMFIPILSIVLLVLANKAIRKDEQLVKSADRLR